MALLTKEQMYTINNVARTTSLIYELHRPGDEPVFTLSRVRDDYIRLADIFIELTVDDPTEVTFAEHVFGSVSFWKNLEKTSRLQPHLEAWREEADARRKKIAFKALIEEARSGGRSASSAARYLIEEPWKPKTKETAKSKRKSTEKAFHDVVGDKTRLKEFLQ